ncbi:MAG: type II toxin-antitoxin system death-on-curing family toxin [Cyanomargarita calcarea GSE-NOS-MK-12-04C]|jgi:death-on-curing protein|uniref:Type II toxin-antitoxin system death-on-curing family toxin n=1 Tax=Cyanomargarita calcarea GSE-NOS-MK-12-04C TaxID=2839659 RepID=A0A951QTV1_9CYAN|nr:type II toxin-antitoxin system death-on-curing family toxin [Cyanomargarita calcarea GSE-NOS-MK-12-04C]
MNFPNKFDVLAIHAQLIAATGGSEGLRDEGVLESALSATQNRLYYEQADLVTCAATYAYHLTKAHAFIDGNKRVAAAVTETFLETNGAKLNLSKAYTASRLYQMQKGHLGYRAPTGYSTKTRGVILLTTGIRKSCRGFDLYNRSKLMCA